MINDGCATGYSQYHEGRIGGDIIGNLTRGCVIDRLSTMRRQERTLYNYAAANQSNNNSDAAPVPPPPPLQINVASPASVTSSTTADDTTTLGSSNNVPPLNSSWREKICHWSFNVIDHFDLSREVVAVSMSLFDRYLATRGNRCNGSTALLASLTTLHIAIKVHEVRKIKLTTLANLSRGQFGPKHIEEMEWQVLASLNWHIHPPTSMSFLSHLLLLLPEKVSDASKEEIYAMSRYITELSVCDSSFVNMNPSAVAYSAILNSFEDKRYRRLITPAIREQFFRAIATHVGLSQDDEHVLLARPKLKRLLITSLGTENLPQDGHCSASSNSSQQNATVQGTSTSSQPSYASAAQQHQSASRQHDQTVASVTSSVGGMSIQDSSYSSTTRGAGGMGGGGGGRSRSNSITQDNISLNKTSNMSIMSSGSGGGGGGDDNSSMCSSKLSLKSSQSSSGYDSGTSSSQPRRMLVPPLAGGSIVIGGRGSRVAPSPGGGGVSPCSLTSSRSGGRSSVFSRTSRSHSRSPMTSLLPSS
jgi:hypothetical protein